MFAVQKVAGLFQSILLFEVNLDISFLINGDFLQWIIYTIICLWIRWDARCNKSYKMFFTSAFYWLQNTCFPIFLFFLNTLLVSVGIPVQVTGKKG